MSETIKLLSEIPPGTHLVEVAVVEPLAEGVKGVAIRLNKAVGTSKISDINLTMPSPLFSKFCQGVSGGDLDLSKPFRQQVLGKQLWMCVREVRVIQHDGTLVMSRNEIFDFIPDVGAKPIISGDPCQRESNEPMGAFLSFHELQPGEALNITAKTVEKVPEGISYIPNGSIGLRSEKIDASKLTAEAIIKFTDNNIFSKKLREQEAADKVAAGKKIMEDAKNKQENSVVEVNDPFEIELKNITSGESEDNQLSAEDPWG